MLATDTAIFTLSLGLVVSMSINVIAGLRIRKLQHELDECGCAISFARMQMGYIGRGFLRRWQDGELHTSDPILVDEWKQFRKSYFERLEARESGVLLP